MEKVQVGFAVQASVKQGALGRCLLMVTVAEDHGRQWLIFFRRNNGQMEEMHRHLLPSNHLLHQEAVLLGSYGADELYTVLMTHVGISSDIGVLSE